MSAFHFFSLHFLQFKCRLFGKQMLRSLQIEEQKIFTDHHLLVQERLKCCSPAGGYGYMLEKNLSLLKFIYIHDTTIKFK